MKIIVTKAFRDKHTKERYPEGTELDVKKGRFAEMEKNLGPGYVEKVEEPQEDKEG